MSAADIAVGMMDSAYFTSRNELLQFFNTTFNLNLTKIEQTASGAVACQLTEYLFPNSIPMSKVNWSAKSSHEYVANYKLLQKAFTKNKVQRFVDVDKLIRGKYQDNLEFCQWLKAFFDQQIGAACGREDYDPVAVRARGKGGKTVPSNSRGANKAAAARGSSRSNAPAVGKPRIGVTSSTTTAASTSSRSPRRVQTSSSATTSSTTSSSTRTARPARERATQKENNITNNLPTAAASRKPTTTPTTTTTAASSATIQKYKEEIKVLKSQNTELTTQISELQIVNTKYDMDMKEIESERDFYFEKLRGIEVMLQVYKEKEESGELLAECGSSGDETKKVIDKIFKVMYAAMEDNVVVDDEGNLIGDITLDESVLRSNLSLDDLRPQAQDEMIITGEEAVDDVEDTDELLVSPPVVENVDSSAMNDFVPVAVAPAEESDDDDDELLTSGIVSPVNDNEEMLATDNHVEVVGNADTSAIPPESDDDDDDELLTSGIDSGDEGEEADTAANRSAENARVISQLVGDNDDDISDEDLLVEDGDDASQDEY